MELEETMLRQMWAIIKSNYINGHEVTNEEIINAFKYIGQKEEQITNLLNRYPLEEQIEIVRKSLRHGNPYYPEPGLA